MNGAIRLFTKGSIGVDTPPLDVWPRWKKVALTSAVRIDGPFRVETSETENEPFLCEDGWLAVDARGYPYAIAHDEFSQIYTQAVARDFVVERLLDILGGPDDSFALAAAKLLIEL